MTDTLLPPELYAKAREVVEANRAAGRTVAVAESCTGGLVCAALTEIPGSSEMFEAGYVTYSNDAKANALSVHADVVEAHHEPTYTVRTLVNSRVPSADSSRP